MYICGESSCQDQYLFNITAKGKASFKSLTADDTQLVQKFKTLLGVEYAPKNDDMMAVVSVSLFFLYFLCL